MTPQPPKHPLACHNRSSIKKKKKTGEVETEANLQQMRIQTNNTNWGDSQGGQELLFTYLNY